MIHAGIAICRRDEGWPLYFSAKQIAAASGFGSWTTDITKALCFASAMHAEDFAKMALRTFEPFLDYVPT